MLLELLISCAPGSSLRVAVKIQTSELLQRGAKPSRTGPFRSKFFFTLKVKSCAVQVCTLQVCTLQSKSLSGSRPGFTHQRAWLAQPPAHGTMQMACFGGVQILWEENAFRCILAERKPRPKRGGEGRGVGKRRPNIFFSGSHACSYVSHSSSDLLFFSVPASTGVLSRINYERPAHDAHFHSVHERTGLGREHT